MRRLEPKKKKRQGAAPARHRSWWRGKFTLRHLLYGAMALGIAGIAGSVGWFFYGGKAARLEHQFLSAAADSSVKMGLNLQNIYLEGKNYTKSDSIIQALGVRIGQPLLTIPLDDIKQRLEKLDWIKSAVIERQLPNTLHVRIVERNPVALWQNAGQLYLIDEDGVLIVEDNLKPFKHLIILVGGDAPMYANQLLTMLKKDMELYKHASSAIRVGERRWNIRFAEGIEIKLPEENPEEAWKFISDMHRDDKLFNKNIRSVDLRVQGKMYINLNSKQKTPRNDNENS